MKGITDDLVARPTAAHPEAVEAALAALLKAALATRAYLAQLREGKIRGSFERDQKLAKLWRTAHGKLVAAGERRVADIALIKADCWSDERLWNDPRYAPVPLDLNSIIDECRRMTRERGGGGV